MAIGSEGYWNRKSVGYDERLPEKGPNYAARLHRAFAVMDADAAVLDVGCATGEITLDLAPKCGRIVGIDTADQMIDLARAKAAERGVANVDFQAIDPSDPSLAPSSFDVITCYSLFHLVDDYHAMLQRFAQLVRPGGYVLNETPCLGDWGVHWRVLLKVMVGLRLVPRVVPIRVEDLEQAFGQAGFEVLDSQVYNPKSGQHCVLARRVG